MQPIVSIIIPCYQQGQFLSEALNSVLKQTVDNWECIIINDGSPDNTEEIAYAYIQKDNRFKYVKKQNGGLSSARNAGIRIAKGIFILPLDADDIVGPQYLEKAVEIFQANPTIELVYCNAELFGERTGDWNLPAYSYSTLLLENIIFCSCIYYRDKALEIGLYDENIKLGFEDWEFLLRLLNENSQVFQLKERLFFYRIKRQSMLTELINDRKYHVSVKENIYKLHAGMIIKHHGDWIDLINGNKILRQEKEMYQNFIPKRSLKNALKFLLGRKLFFKGNQREVNNNTKI